MAIKPEDLAWFVKWAEVLQKVKDGASSSMSVSLSPDECRTMVRGLQGLSQTIQEQEAETGG